jgi:hypothetical protein
MPTYPRSESPEEIERKIKEGRGSGEKEHYKPWIYTHEITSQGNSTVAWSHKLNREVHLFSDGEFHLWTVLEYSSKVVDYWEQYPHLPIDRTIKLAEEKNILYPRLSRPKNKSISDPKVLTTDFVATVSVNDETVYHPISFKYSKSQQESQNEVGTNTLADQRSLLKIELERLSWGELGHKLKIFTEKDIPGPIWKNLNQALSFYKLERVEEADVHDIAAYLAPRIEAGNRPLRDITRECDHQLGYPKGSGTALSVVWHLIAHHKWKIDLTTLVNSNKPLKLISISL